MGTFSDSKFVTTRKEHRCDQCGGLIEIGKEALAYRLGLKWVIYAHTECVMRKPKAYRCAAVEQRRY